jgi:hypothetical protein
MARRIDDAASESQHDTKYDSPEPTELANDNREASRLLSISVEQMKYELKSTVSALERVVPVTVEKERSLRADPSIIEISVHSDRHDLCYDPFHHPSSP